MTLFVVGLPIGNVDDISFRALKTLSEAEYLICEDTRMFNNLWSKLMSLGRVKKFEGKLRFINDFNEERQLLLVINDLSTIESAVLVSDAGMPLISDPGYKLVRAVWDMGGTVKVVPGPTAESAALAVSGLPTDKYLFLGFLPKKEGKRTDLLKGVLENQEKVKSTLVIYESSQRTEKIIKEMKNLFGGEKLICVAVDLTKVSEKLFRGTINEVLGQIEGKKLKGEVTLVVSLL